MHNHNLENNQPRVVIIGGGISGLSAANRLTELSLENKLELEFILLEGRNRLGGLISTKQIDDYIVEEGPDSFISTKPWALDLCTRIGSQSNIIQKNNEALHTFVLKNGELLTIPKEFFMFTPTNPLSLVTSPLFTWLGKLRMVMDLFLPPRKSQEDESVASFFRRRLGSEVLDLIVQPIISGIYAADTENLSIRATLPKLIEMEAQHGSLIKATRNLRKSYNSNKSKNNRPEYGQFVSFKAGMENLIEDLSKRLPKKTIQLNRFVTNIEMKKGVWRLVLNDRNIIDASGIIIAIPSNRAANLLKEFDPILSDNLSKIKYTSTTIINLAYNRKDISHKLNGSGFVVPKFEGLPILACTFSSVKFPGRAPPDTVLLRCFMADAKNPEISERDDSYLIETTHRIISNIIGIQSPPVFSIVSRNPQCMPQYTVGHLDNVARINDRTLKYPSLQLAGNAYGGVGIPDCIHSGETAAVNLFKHINNKRSGNLYTLPI